jgi:hypothetical protein
MKYAGMTERYAGMQRYAGMWACKMHKVRGYVGMQDA